MKINNGTRGMVRFGDIEREAHMVDHRGRVRLAFFGEVRDLRRVDTVEFGGEHFTIVGNAEKGDVKGTVVVTIERIEAVGEGG